MTEVDGRVGIPGDGSGAGPGVGQRVLDWLGPESAERAAPSLRDTFAGIGGAVLAVGVVIMIVGDHPSRGKFVAAGLLLAFAGWAVRMFVKVAALQALAVGLFVVGGVVFSIAATVSDGDNSTFATGIVMVAVFGGAYVLPGLRRRNLLLGIAALSLVFALGTLSTPDTDRYDKCMQYMSDGDYDRFDAECQGVYGEASTSALPRAYTDQIGDEGLIYLAGAVVLFAGTWWLDRKGRKGPATALVAAGLVAAFVGTVLKVADFGETSGPMFVALVGVVVCIVGSHGARRATTWWGAYLAAGGLIAFIATEMKPTSTSGMGSVAVIASIVLVGTALIASAIQDASDRDAAAAAPAASPPQQLPPPQ